MKPHLFLSCLFLTLTFVAARRLPFQLPYNDDLQLVDEEDAIPLKHNEVDDASPSQQSNGKGSPQVMEKRALGQHSNPSYSHSSRGRLSKPLFTGKDKLEGCKNDLVLTPKATMECKTYSGCRVECEDGYRFPDKSVLLMFVCNNGKWIAEGTTYKSVPECEPDEDAEYQYDDECETFVAPDNSRANCPAEKSYCEMGCHKGYKLPGNKKQVILTCEEGQWVASGTEDQKIPACEPEEPVCNDSPPLPPKTTLSCESNTTCKATCEKGYKFPSGSSSVAISCTADGWTLQAEGDDGTTGCLQELLTCDGQPPTTLMNATIECGDTSCSATCIEGHKFPNQKSRINIECKKDKWKVVGIDWNVIPDCVQEAKTYTKCNGSQYLQFPNLGTYKVNTTHVSWPEAQRTCMREGSYLAVINSKKELELMKELIAPYHMKNGWTYAHIGFTDQAKRGVWVTVLGQIMEAVKFTQWAPRNPSKLNERCGAIDHLGRLHDIFCKSEQIFICEKV